MQSHQRSKNRRAFLCSPGFTFLLPSVLRTYIKNVLFYYTWTRELGGAWPLYLFIYSHHICVCGLEASAVSPKRARTRGFAPSVLKQNSGRKNQKQNPKFILIQDKSDESAPCFALAIFSCILGKYFIYFLYIYLNFLLVLS